MASNYKTGILITGDAKGGVKAVNLTKDSLKKLDTEQKKVGSTASNLASKMKGSIVPSFGSFAAVLGVSTLGVAGITLAVKKMVGQLDHIGKTASTIGITTKSLQELTFAAQRSGVEQATLEKGLKNFGIQLVEAAKGTGVLKTNLDRYNISAVDANGNVREFDDVLNDVADAVKNAKTEQEKLNIAYSAFGTRGAAFVVALKDGAAGLDEFRQKANDLHLILSDDLINSAQKTQDRLGDVGDVIHVALINALSAALPLLDRFAQGLLNISSLAVDAADALRGVADRTNISTLRDQLDTVTSRMQVLRGLIDEAGQGGGGQRAIAAYRAELNKLTVTANTVSERLIDLQKESQKTAQALPTIQFQTDPVLAFIKAMRESAQVEAASGETKAALTAKQRALNAGLTTGIDRIESAARAIYREQQAREAATTAAKKQADEIVQAEKDKEAARKAATAAIIAQQQAAKKASDDYIASQKEEVQVLEARIAGGERGGDVEQTFIELRKQGVDITRDQIGAYYDEIGQLKKVLDQTKTTADQWNKIWDNAVENMQREFTDEIYNALFDGGIKSFGDFANAIVDIWKHAIANMVAAWVTNGITDLFSGAGFAGFSLSNLLGGKSGGAASKALSVANLVSGIKSGASTIGSALAGILGGSAVATPVASAATSLGVSIADAAATGLGTTAATTSLANAGTAAGTSYGAAFSGAVGGAALAAGGLGVFLGVKAATGNSFERSGRIVGERFASGVSAGTVDIGKTISKQFEFIGQSGGSQFAKFAGTLDQFRGLTNDITRSFGFGTDGAGNAIIGFERGAEKLADTLQGAVNPSAEGLVRTLGATTDALHQTSHAGDLLSTSQKAMARTIASGLRGSIAEIGKYGGAMLAASAIAQQHGTTFAQVSQQIRDQAGAAGNSILGLSEAYQTAGYSASEAGALAAATLQQVGGAADAAGNRLASMSAKALSGLSGAARSARDVASAINAIPDKTINITTNYLTGRDARSGPVNSSNNDPQPGSLGLHAMGADFIVPGSGTSDLPFRIGLTPGERVTVTPRGQVAAGRNDRTERLLGIIADENAAMNAELRDLRRDVRASAVRTAGPIVGTLNAQQLQARAMRAR